MLLPGLSSSSVILFLGLYEPMAHGIGHLDFSVILPLMLGFGVTLVLCARESPLSPIHLRNLSELSMIPGVTILPPMMTFYNRPVSVEEMTHHMVCKLLGRFGIEPDGFRRWEP